MRGDILLYHNDGSLPGNLIAFATHGPFIHAEVDMGDGSSIGALTRGVVEYVPTASARKRAVVVPLNRPSSCIEHGLAWLHMQVGGSYGWVDIFNQALLWLKLPKLFFFIPGTYDCSDLVARYVEIAGGLNLGNLAETPELCSPNDLARAAGLLPGR